MTHPWERRGLGGENLNQARAARTEGGARGSLTPRIHSAAQQWDMKGAVQAFLAANPIIEWIEAQLGDVKLKRVTTSGGGEWAGPCVVCLGVDRMRVWPAPSEGNPRAWCRQCGVSGDALRLALVLAGRDPNERGAVSRMLVEQGLLQAAKPEVCARSAFGSRAVPSALPPAPRCEAPVTKREVKESHVGRDERFVRGTETVASPPTHGCWNCGSREFARDLVGRGWVCARCHPPSEQRADLPRCRSLLPSKRFADKADLERAS